MPVPVPNGAGAWGARAMVAAVRVRRDGVARVAERQNTVIGDREEGAGGAVVTGGSGAGAACVGAGMNLGWREAEDVSGACPGRPVFVLGNDW